MSIIVGNRYIYPLLDKTFKPATNNLHYKSSQFILIMNPRKLFNVILKIFGLFFLREIIIAIPQVFTSVAPYFSGADIWTIITALGFVLLTLGFYTAIAIQLLFKTDKFIDVLKLDKEVTDSELSFDTQNDFTIDLNSNTLLTISLIVVAGVILTDEIPDFCRQLYVYVNQNSFRFNSIKPDPTYLITSAVKILLGLLILGERKRIVDFIETKKQVSVTEEVEE